MSRHGTLLPIPPQPGSMSYWTAEWLVATWAGLVQSWPDSQRWPFRSRWLSEAEAVLARAYPSASSADRKLTARHYAPFPLAQGPNVP